MRGKILTDTWVLALGDILTIGLVTIIGFARHGDVLATGLRPLTTFLPYSLTWLLIAPFVGAYKPGLATDPRQLWRPAVAALAAAPFAAMLRSIILQTAIQPIFVLVLGLTGTFGILVWRMIILFLQNRLRAVDG